MQKSNFARLRHRCRPTSCRRSEKRLLCSDLIKVQWVDELGHRREEIVVLEGYSSSGASLLLGVPIAAGTLITLRGGAEAFRATVRHCAPTSNGYLAGVNFGEQSGSYVPEHLLDTSRLVYSGDS